MAVEIQLYAFLRSLNALICRQKSMDVCTVDVQMNATFRKTIIGPSSRVVPEGVVWKLLQGDIPPELGISGLLPLNSLANPVSLNIFNRLWSNNSI